MKLTPFSVLLSGLPLDIAVAMPSLTYSANFDIKYLGVDKGANANAFFQAYSDLNCINKVGLFTVVYGYEGSIPGGFGSWSLSRNLTSNEQLDFSVTDPKLDPNDPYRSCGLYTDSAGASTDFVSHLLGANG